MADIKPPELDFDILEGNVGVQIHLTRRALWSRAGKVRPKQHQGKPSGYLTALIVIGANPGLSQKRLADELFLDAGAIGDIVDDLEREGLVERERDPSDRRRLKVSLTKRGQQRWKDVRTSVADRDKTVRSMLSDAEVVVLLDLLKRLRRAERDD